VLAGKLEVARGGRRTPLSLCEKMPILANAPLWAGCKHFSLIAEVVPAASLAFRLSLRPEWPITRIQIPLFFGRAQNIGGVSAHAEGCPSEEEWSPLYE